jgi:hypothetical protein
MLPEGKDIQKSWGPSKSQEEGSLHRDLPKLDKQVGYLGIMEEISFITSWKQLFFLFWGTPF